MLLSGSLLALPEIEDNKLTGTKHVDTPLIDSGPAFQLPVTDSASCLLLSKPDPAGGLAPFGSKVSTGQV